MSEEQKAEGEEMDIDEMSVSELCEEIAEAPAYDAEIGLTAEQMGRAYERLRLVAVELVGWMKAYQGEDEGEGGRE